MGVGGGCRGKNLKNKCAEKQGEGSFSCKFALNETRVSASFCRKHIFYMCTYLCVKIYKQCIYTHFTSPF